MKNRMMLAVSILLMIGMSTSADQAAHAGFKGIHLSAGTHEIQMVSAGTSGGWNDILYFQQNNGLVSGSVDYCFTLNGVGDSRTIDFVSAGELHVGVADSYIGDNAGIIIFSVDGVDHTLDIGTYSAEFDGWIEDFQAIPIAQGTHDIQLVSASTTGGWNDILYFQQNDGLAAGSVDYCFTLNGVGDSRTVEFTSAGELHVGVADSYIGDTSGTITISIDGVDHTVDIGLHSAEFDGWTPVVSNADSDWGSIKKLYR